MSELDIVIQDWHDEVDAEMILLITAGTPPEAARIDAIYIVSSRRKQEHADKKGG